MIRPVEGRIPVDTLIERAREDGRAGAHAAARAAYEGALYRLGERPSVTPAALLRWIARAHQDDGDVDAARDCLEASVAVAEAHGSAADIAHALNCHGVCHFERGQLDDAEALFGQAREMAEEADDWTLVAMVDQNLGNVAGVHGDRSLAEARYRRSLQLYRAQGLDEYVGPLLNNLGRLQTDSGDWLEAAASLTEAAEYCERSGAHSDRVLIEVNRCRLFVAEHQLSRARDACEDALELATELSDDRWLGHLRLQRGIVFRAQHRPRLAEANLEQALQEALRREDLLLEAEVRTEWAALHRDEDRNREALESLGRAREAFTALRAGPELADVQRRIRRLQRRFEGVVRDWADSIESKDRYTRGHCERVANYACRLAVRAGVGNEELPWFRMGALLHDVGKIAVPSEILNKVGTLTEREWEVMRSHPEEGVRLLDGIEFPWDIRPMVRHHHERWDGSGYPNGLRGEEIPLSARILCVADVYDALTTTRSYREAFSREEALAVMSADRGRVFDPTLLVIFEELVTADAKARRLIEAPLPRLVRPGRLGYARRPPMSAVA